MRNTGGRAAIVLRTVGPVALRPDLSIGLPFIQVFHAHRLAAPTRILFHADEIFPRLNAMTPQNGIKVYIYSITWILHFSLHFKLFLSRKIFISYIQKSPMSFPRHRGSYQEYHSS
jgi:hypothetical protein